MTTREAITLFNTIFNPIINKELLRVMAFHCKLDSEIPSAVLYFCALLVCAAMALTICGQNPPYG